ncbi:MAG: hypothetical protein Q9227_006322 [Pyrenula ochraceoflavens]
MASLSASPEISSTDSRHSRCVGFLYENNLSNDGNQNCNSRKIFSDQQHVIGRDPGKCHQVINDITVSSKHLRIYTVVVDQEEASRIPPLVYAEDLSRYGTYCNGTLIGKGRGGFLLSDGDVLQISARILITFKACLRDWSEIMFDDIQENEMDLFRERYNVTDRILGAGAFGQVFMAIEQSSKRQVACKIINLRKLAPRPRVKFGPRAEPAPATEVNDAEQLEKLHIWKEKIKVENAQKKKIQRYFDEANILAQVDHPNIIAIEKVFKTDNTIYIFQELITGGDLFSYLEAKGGVLKEVEAIVVMRQILIAVDYLHDNGIAHRDLKPENVLMTSVLDGCRIVLTDFGGATTFHGPRVRMTTSIGTLEYSAPEVTGRPRGYTQAVDMWSIGCITAVLLTGASPFRDPQTNRYSQKLASECNLTDIERDKDWEAVAARPKDFVKKLLHLDERLRLNAKQALSHAWFTNDIYERNIKDLYNRTTSRWRPKLVRLPLIEDLEDNDAQSRHMRPLSSIRSSKKKIRQPIEPPYKPYPRKLNKLLSPKTKCRPLCARSDVLDAVHNVWNSGISMQSDSSHSRFRLKQRCSSYSFALPSHKQDIKLPFRNPHVKIPSLKRPAKSPLQKPAVKEHPAFSRSPINHGSTSISEQKVRLPFLRRSLPPSSPKVLQQESANLGPNFTAEVPNAQHHKVLKNDDACVLSRQIISSESEAPAPDRSSAPEVQSTGEPLSCFGNKGPRRRAFSPDAWDLRQSSPFAVDPMISNKESDKKVSSNSIHDKNWSPKTELRHAFVPARERPEKVQKQNGQKTPPRPMNYETASTSRLRAPSGIVSRRVIKTHSVALPSCTPKAPTQFEGRKRSVFDFDSDDDDDEDVPLMKKVKELAT